MTVHSVATQPIHNADNQQAIAVRPPALPAPDATRATTPAATELHLGNHIDIRA
jgi:hypothetical protein